MTFLTNNAKWAAGTICELYKARWEIEVFFKELKQTLQFADFIGTNENAVKWQIWTGLLTHLLLHYLKFLSGWNKAFSRLVGIVRSAVWMVTIPCRAWRDSLAMHDWRSGLDVTASWCMPSSPRRVNFLCGGFFLLFGIFSAGRLANIILRAFSHESSRTSRSAHCHPPDEASHAPGSASSSRNALRTDFDLFVLKRYRTSAASQSPITDSFPNDTSPRTSLGFFTDETNSRYSVSIERECVPEVSFPGCTTTASVSLSFAMHSVW